MVEINLLPQQYRKQSIPSAWRYATYALIPLTVAAILIPEVVTSTRVGDLNRELDALNGDAAALAPAKQKFDSLTAEARSLEQVGYRNVRLQLEPPDPMSSQVLTLDAPAEATALAQLLGLPRLQGERFELQNGEVAVWLGTDAQTQLAALLPLRRPTDGRQLGLTAQDTAALLGRSTP